jgi:hypothetical protein
MTANLLATDTRRRRIENLVMQVEGEFLDTPGLRMTVADGQRRFGIDEVTCEAILEALVDGGVLLKRSDRVYERLFPHRLAA